MMIMMMMKSVIRSHNTSDSFINHILAVKKLELNNVNVLINLCFSRGVYSASASRRRCAASACGLQRIGGVGLWSLLCCLSWVTWFHSQTGKKTV